MSETVKMKDLCFVCNDSCCHTCLVWLVFTWWQLGCYCSAKPKKKGYRIQRVLRPEPSILPHPGGKHWSWADLSGVVHEDYIMTNQLTQNYERQTFSLRLSVWTREDIFPYKAEELLALLSSKQTDVHHCLGVFSIFNRIMAVLLSNTKKKKKKTGVLSGLYFVSLLKPYQCLHLLLVIQYADDVELWCDQIRETFNIQLNDRMDRVISFGRDDTIKGTATTLTAVYQGLTVL